MNTFVPIPPPKVGPYERCSRCRVLTRFRGEDEALCRRCATNAAIVKMGNRIGLGWISPDEARSA